MMLDSIYSGNPSRNNWLLNAFIELGYHPASAFGFDLKLAEAMRAPTLKEMYACYLYNRVDGYDYIGSPAIKKESSFNTEINFSYRQKDFDATIKGFGYFFQNYIAGLVQMDYMPMTAGANGVKQYGNIHSANIIGASLLFNWHLSSKILFSSNTTIQQGKDDNNNYLPMMMPLKSINTLRYAASNWRFFVEGIGASAQNKTSAFYGETNVPGFFIADAGADKTIDVHGGSQLIFSLTCDNIFNTYYYESADVIKLPRAGRNFILHVTYNF
jgi:iron complex outermembrane receptor protein